jgi:subtilase family serine protease
MAGGTYNLRATVDQPNDFVETNEHDNCTNSRIQIPAAGEGQIIVVEDNRVPCST